MRTDTAMPSISMILSICHPEMSHFKSAATAYGCEHEKKGRDRYTKESQPNHQEFKVSKSGFFISLSILLLVLLQMAWLTVCLW